MHRIVNETTFNDFLHLHEWLNYFINKEVIFFLSYQRKENSQIVLISKDSLWLVRLLKLCLVDCSKSILVLSNIIFLHKR